MKAEGCVLGARDLILAIFRLAVADYRGLSYGHDEHDRLRHVPPVHRPGASSFLRSPWAAHLADLVGLSSAVIWSEARRLRSACTGRTGTFASDREGLS
jgi:hypothetical protein